MRTFVILTVVVLGMVIAFESLAGNSQTVIVPPPGIRDDTARSMSSSANYRIDWQSNNGGGVTLVSSPGYTMGLSAGQSIAGETDSAATRAGIGFWYGDCICYCAHEPDCNGECDVIDVVSTVNVAFRNAAPMPDPSQLCPWQRTDVNCDQHTDIIDLVMVVSCAFRNALADTLFCSPCR